MADRLTEEQIILWQEEAKVKSAVFTERALQEIILALAAEARLLLAERDAYRRLLACDAHQPSPGDGGEMHPPCCVICDLLAALDENARLREWRGTDAPPR